jgi:hypothetical protein
MRRPATVLADNFISHLNYIELTRSRMEDLYSKNIIVRRDIEHIYSGMYLEAFGSFESFIERLFVNLMLGRYRTVSQRTIPRFKINSEMMASEIIMQHKKYVNWIPYDATEERAKIFFRNNNVFSSLIDSDKDTIKKAFYIRNAIAHKSKQASEKFIKHVIGNIPLTPRDSTPSGFLRTVWQISPSQTRYEFYMVELANIARKIC